MGCYIADLRNKEVICKTNGCRIGNVDDVIIDVCSGKLESLVIYGRGKIMGVIGKCEDIIIPWCDIDVIGEDTILVNCNITLPPPKKPFHI